MSLGLHFGIGLNLLLPLRFVSGLVNSRCSAIELGFIDLSGYDIVKASASKWFCNWIPTLMSLETPPSYWEECLFL
jgi:hypothetical protein